LRFVDRDDLGFLAQPASDLFGGIDGLGFDRNAVMGRNGVEAGVARI
jgi:hypothetical protein